MFPSKTKMPTAILACLFFLGAVLRLVWLSDMEFFSDQQGIFRHAMGPLWNPDKNWVQNGLGIVTSVGVLSPGLTYWIYQIPAKIFSLDSPLELTLFLRLTNVAALAGFLFFALRVVERAEREVWLWAWALLLVNPFAVFFQRRLWPPSIFPIFACFLLIAWWRRDRVWGAFLLGLLGALIAQIHLLAGLFWASLLLWAWANRAQRASFLWRPLLLGAALGAIPAIPWLVYMIGVIQEGIGVGERHWEVAHQLRFWRYWFTQPFGLLLTYFLEPGGYFREYLAMPKLAGQATHLVLAIHTLVGALLLLFVGVLIRALLKLICAARKERSWSAISAAFWGSSNTDSAVNAAFLGYGLSMMLKTFYVFRHYLILTAPLEFAWLARSALRANLLWGRRGLALLWVLQLGMTIFLLIYIHQNGGAPGAEYGHTYREQLRMGEWTTNNNPIYHRDTFKPKKREQGIPQTFEF